MRFFFKNPYQTYLKTIERVMQNKSHMLLGTSGSEVYNFERELAKYLNISDIIALNSCTDALIHAMRIFEIGLGDEVIVPAFSFISTASSVAWVGATPRFVDIREDNFTVDIDQVRSVIGNKTKAIIPVHIFGYPADIESLTKISNNKGIKIIEDAAQAIGATTNGLNIGTIGDTGCFSFSSLKPLFGFGNGGALFFRDSFLIQKTRMVSTYGAKRHYSDYPYIGNNSRMQELNAAILCEKLPHLNSYLETRNEYSQIYNELLKNVGDLVLPKNKDGRIYYRYVIRTKFRNDLRDYLSKNLRPQLARLLTINYPIPLPYLEAFSYLKYQENQFPVSEKISREVLSLPLTEELKENDIYDVCGLIKKFFTCNRNAL